MNASGRVWMPGFGGTSTAFRDFSRKALSSNPMIVGMSGATCSTSASER
jgi:hypothetical protein